jgi:hypothetical protein
MLVLVLPQGHVKRNFFASQSNVGEPQQAVGCFSSFGFTQD